MARYRVPRTHPRIGVQMGPRGILKGQAARDHHRALERIAEYNREIGRQRLAAARQAAAAAQRPSNEANTGAGSGDPNPYERKGAEGGGQQVQVALPSARQLPRRTRAKQDPPSHAQKLARQDWKLVEGQVLTSWLERRRQTNNFSEPPLDGKTGECKVIAPGSCTERSWEVDLIDINDLMCPASHYLFLPDLNLDFLVEVKRRITFCACHAPASRLAELGYLASSTSRPGSAFSFALLDLYEKICARSPVALSVWIRGIFDTHRSRQGVRLTGRNTEKVRYSSPRVRLEAGVDPSMFH